MKNYKDTVFPFYKNLKEMKLINRAGFRKTVRLRNVFPADDCLSFRATRDKKAWGQYILLLISPLNKSLVSLSVNFFLKGGLMNWFLLVIAGLFEVAFAFCLGKAKEVGENAALWYSLFCHNGYY